MPKKRSKPLTKRQAPTPGVTPGTRQIQFVPPEGEEQLPVFHANAGYVETLPPGVILHAGYIDSRSGSVSGSLQVCMPACALVELAMREESLSAVMSKWQKTNVPFPDLRVALEAHPERVVPTFANFLNASISAHGGELAFLWVSPADIARQTPKVPLHPVVLVRMHPELCGKLWMDLLDAAKSVVVDKRFDYLGQLHPRFKK
jgi:hypothetical protein